MGEPSEKQDLPLGEQTQKQFFQGKRRKGKFMEFPFSEALKTALTHFQSFSKV